MTTSFCLESNWSIDFQRAHGLEQLEQLFCLRLSQITPDRIAQPHILLEIPQRLVGISAVPDGRIQVVFPAPGFEGFDLLRAAPEQELRRRKSIRIAPDRGEAIISLVDEIAQVGSPAPIIVAEKKQAAVVFHQ